MEAFIYVIVSIVSLALFVLETLMFLRAILSWFPFDEDSALIHFLYCVTEPVILPVRILLQKIDFIAGLPIDISFLVTYLLLNLISMSLPIVNF